jgi:hypothetical protein
MDALDKYSLVLLAGVFFVSFFIWHAPIFYEFLGAHGIVLIPLLAYLLVLHGVARTEQVTQNRRKVVYQKWVLLPGAVLLFVGASYNWESLLRWLASSGEESSMAVAYLAVWFWLPIYAIIGSVAGARFTNRYVANN